MSIKLPECGYTPRNFAALVDATGMSNASFIRKFNIKHSSFYKWCAGDRSMSHKTWETLLNDVQSHVSSTRQQSKVVFNSKGVQPVLFLVDSLSAPSSKLWEDKQIEAVAELKVVYNDSSNKVKALVFFDEPHKSYDFFIQNLKGVSAIREVILKTIAADLKSSNNAEFLLDVDRNSAAIHNSIIREIESSSNLKRRKK